MFNLHFPMNSIFLQIKALSVGIAITSAMIVGALCYQAYQIQTVLLQHQQVLSTDKTIAEFNRAVSDVKLQSMALASTGNSGPNVLGRVLINRIPNGVIL